jgi:hypothetical protein
VQKSRSAEAKGINFRGLLDAIGALHGPEAQRSVISACGGEVGALLARGGLTAGHAAAQRTLRRTDVARECARWAIQRDLSGIYRVLLFLLTPDSIISKCPRIMQQYWRGGVMRVPLVRDGMAAVEFVGWSGFDQNVWQDIVGSVEGGLEAAGAESVRIRTIAGGQNGDDDLSLEVRWTARRGAKP